MEPVILVLTTVGSEDQGIQIAESLVERGHAACVNIIKKIRSIYRWKGEIWDDEEFLLVIKTRESLFPQVRETIQSLKVKRTLPDLPDLLVQIFCFFRIPSSRLLFLPRTPSPCLGGRGKGARGRIHFGRSANYPRGVQRSAPGRAPGARSAKRGAEPPSLKKRALHRGARPPPSGARLRRAVTPLPLRGKTSVRGNLPLPPHPLALPRRQASEPLGPTASPQPSPRRFRRRGRG